MQGLQNLGSTCAVNSLIQIICRTDHLRNIILKEEIPANTLSAELREILDMMHNNNHSISPNKFINHLYKHFDGIFSRGEQIDISELWMFLFDKLATELAHNVIEEDAQPQLPRIEDLDVYDNVKLSNNLNLKHHCHLAINTFNGKKTSTWLDTSQGIMLNIIECNECHNVLYNFEPFIYITLDIPENSDTVPSVATMFKTYLKGQISTDDWKCEKCDRCTSYNKFLKIWKMPKVLIFIVKRFTNARDKNTTPIHINRTLCIKKGSVINDMLIDYKYTCTSLGYHFGNLFGGHYCALCEVNKQIIMYDDLNINIIQDNEQIKKIFEQNREAYMLVYTL